MRRHGRQCALQILFQMDLQRLLDQSPVNENVIEISVLEYWNNFEAAEVDDKEFAERLVRGVISQLPVLDEVIASASRKWRLARMDKVDRNVLRMAAYEILYCADIPRAASINEAVEIAKRFCSQDSAAFVNGILDQLGN